MLRYNYILLGYSGSSICISIFFNQISRLGDNNPTQRYFYNPLLALIFSYMFSRQSVTMSTASTGSIFGSTASTDYFTSNSQAPLVPSDTNCKCTLLYDTNFIFLNNRYIIHNERTFQEKDRISAFKRF